MSVTPVRIEPARTAPLRQRVLRPHQSVAEVVAAMDGPDTVAVAVLEGDEVIACVLAAPEPAPVPLAPDVDAAALWRLRGMATDPDRRGQGLGAAVLQHLLEVVAARGAGVVWCNARVPARGLYERAGFVVVGEPWDEPDIGPHVRMWRRLAAG